MHSTQLDVTANKAFLGIGHQPKQEPSDLQLLPFKAPSDRISRSSSLKLPRYATSPPRLLRRTQSMNAFETHRDRRANHARIRFRDDGDLRLTDAVTILHKRMSRKGKFDEISSDLPEVAAPNVEPDKQVSIKLAEAPVLASPIAAAPPPIEIDASTSSAESPQATTSPATAEKLPRSKPAKLPLVAIALSIGSLLSAAIVVTMLSRATQRSDQKFLAEAVNARRRKLLETVNDDTFGLGGDSNQGKLLREAPPINEVSGAISV